MPDILNMIRSDTRGGIWHTQELGALGEQSQLGPAVAGLLAIPISSTPRDYLIFFRSEEAHNIEWAGEPVKKVVETAHGAAPHAARQLSDVARGRQGPLQALDPARARRRRGDPHLSSRRGPSPQRDHRRRAGANRTAPPHPERRIEPSGEEHHRPGQIHRPCRPGRTPPLLRTTRPPSRGACAPWRSPTINPWAAPAPATSRP